MYSKKSIMQTNNTNKKSILKIIQMYILNSMYNFHLKVICCQGLTFFHIIPELFYIE